MRILAFCILSMVGCWSPMREQRTAADVVARTANAALPVLVEAYRQEGELAIAGAPDRLSARQALERVRTRWAPAWRAWGEARAAHDAWLDALWAGDDASQLGERLRSAYCGLRAAVPPPAELPDLAVGGGCP